MPGVILGTAPYLSPEQARGKVVDRRTDIWSFGCVLYECLSGKRAFQGETVSDTIAKILERDVNWGGLQRSTPQPLREVLRRCLEKDPKKRLRDIGEARLALESLRAGATGGGVIAGAEAAPPPPPTIAGRFLDTLRRRGAFFAGGLILGALLAHNMFDRPKGGGATGLPAHVSVAIPQDIDFAGVGAVLAGRGIVLRGLTRAGRDASPVSRLYVRRLDRDTFEPIRGTEGAEGMVVSADGRWILYFTSPGSNARAGLFKVPVDGSGPPTPMDDAGLEWSAQPVWLESGDVIVSQARGNQYAHVSGSRSVLGKFDAPGRFLTGGQVLPGDRGVLVTRVLQEGGSLRTGVAVLDLHSGKTKVLLQDGGGAAYCPPGYLLFAREGTLFAVRFDLQKLEVKGEPVAILDGLHQPFNHYPGTFDIGSDGTLFYPPAAGAAHNRRLVMVDRAGKVSDWSGEDIPSEFWIAASPDGSRCLTLLSRAGALLAELWVSERGRPARKIPTPPGAGVCGGAWSPDGNQIAYDQTGKADGSYIVNADGSGSPWQVSGGLDGQSIMPVIAWSADGRTLFALDQQGRIYSIEIPTTPGTVVKPRPLFEDNAQRLMPTPSPTGHCVAYMSDETDRMETFVSRWDGRQVVGTPLQVSFGGGGTPKWSRDGKRLYYETAQSKLMAVDIVESPTLRATRPSVAWDLEALRIANFQGAGHLIDFLPDGRMLAVRMAEGEGEPKQVNVVFHFADEVEGRIRAAGR
jgi:serine/threonine-protein kinase